jgi:hypothetical protein
MLILETMVALTRDELIGLISEAREDVPEPAGLCDDSGEVVGDVLIGHMADIFIKMQKLINAMRKRENPRKEETSEFIR